MAVSDIDSVRALPASKPRPVGWQARRSRLDEVGAVWPVAEDVVLEPVDCDGVPGEWSIVPGTDASRTLMFFHGGGYCSGSILSHRRMVTEASPRRDARKYSSSKCPARSQTAPPFVRPSNMPAAVTP